MKDYLDNWLFWLDGLFTDDLISFYAYITTVLAEIAFLWFFFPGIAIPFTILLSISVLNIIVCSWLEGVFEGNKIGLIISRVYVIIFGLLVVIGFFFSWLANIILFVTPLIISFLWIQIRIFQCDSARYKKTVKIFWIISQIFVVGGPFVSFIIGLWFTGLPGWIKMLIVATYFVCAPFIPYIEDAFATKNIFEMAYDNDYNVNCEEWLQKELKEQKKKK